MRIRMLGMESGVAKKRQEDELYIEEVSE